MAAEKPGRNRKTSRHRTQPPWAGLDDEQLLELRFCDLKLEIKGTLLERRIEKLYDELVDRGIEFRPHCWLSTEWFSPDGVPGIAIPFYLAHPRLMKLEESQVLEVEGGTPRWCMQLLRHESAHALDSAFRLHYKRTWREVFGRYSDPYAKFYTPKPYSKSYVLHLDYWYAQSHPAEDWAETFAVWLDPHSRWRKRYRGWSALKKLQYVDRLMQDVAGRKPVVSDARARRVAAAPEDHAARALCPQEAALRARLSELLRPRSEAAVSATARGAEGSFRGGLPQARAARDPTRRSALDRRIPVHHRPGARRDDRTLRETRSEGRSATKPR